MAAGIYVPLDVNYLRDPKIRKAGPDAELLYLRSLAHAKGGNTDGNVYDFDLDVVSVGLTKVQQRVASLVRVGLWDRLPDDDGWHIRGWEKWNKTTSQLKADKENRRRGAELTNHKRYHTGPDGEFSPTCALCTQDRSL